MRRRLLILVLLAALATLAGAADAQAGSWAQPQIRIVVGRGLMASSVSTFRPNDVLTRGALGRLLASLTGQPQTVVHPTAPVTVVGLDAALVRAVGLRSAAYTFRVKTKAAGLRPGVRFGTEVVARLLRLRFNHPAASDGLEQLPTDSITRAETAYSVARVLELSQGDLQWVSWLSTTYSPPQYTTWQLRVLRRAVHFVGYPYIWGGTSEFAEAPFGVHSRGGFDCSGLVWRVYKLQPFADAPRLGTTIHGRTTYEMSGEIPRTQRIARGHLHPADLVFFGDNGTRSTPLQVGHVGMYLGRGWFVHSSSEGVTIVPLSDWYATSFAWGRRPLREVGLA